jgi:transposase
VAVGHSILVMAYHMLQRGTEYCELGPNYFNELERLAVKQRLVRRLEDLGYKVILDQAA